MKIKNIFNTSFTNSKKAQAKGKFNTVFCNNKKARGQAAIEFIFIILIIMVYIFTTTRPFITNSQGTIDDIQNITRINYEAQKIVDTITQISLLGVGSKNTITIIVPYNTTLFCNQDAKTISFKTNINTTGQNPPIGLCQNNNCEKIFKIRQGVNIDCGFTSKTKGIQNIGIIKNDENTVGLYAN
ncbi:MAG: hypothetical protein WC915_03035 [archaeon]|jgi:hypothetical protein